MDWGSVGNKIGTLGLEALGAALPVPGGAYLGSLAAHALGLSKDAAPDQVAAKIDENPENAKVALAQVEAENSEHIEWLRTQQTRITETGKTMRVEYGSEDPVVRRARPTWLYVGAATWALEAIAIVIAVLMATYMAWNGQSTQSAVLLKGLVDLTASLLPLWGVFCTVVGVYVSSRSKDKQVAAGQTPAPGIIGALAARLGGGK